ncbi:DUF4870 domain-containing protein [Formosa sp. 3Alg 14/1]|uniref:DUF4870 domain-containing protein n=1 Tax=unclassified Formosa TaxID=2644710 RepID=UPI0039BEAB5F
MLDNYQKNIATFIHLSTFSRFIIPFGNFIAPTLLWIMNKDKSMFIDKHGKAVINFQISIFLYTVLLGMVTVPFFFYNIFSGFEFIDFQMAESFHFNFSELFSLVFLGSVLIGLAIIGFIIELTLIILASLKAKDGEEFQYPLTIHFIK